MSETDSFIDEVTEEVRRDRLFAMFRRYGWIGIATVFLIVGGAAWNEWTKARATAEARAFGGAVIAALGNDDATARRAALSSIPVEGAGDAVARKAMLGFIAADEALRAGDRDEALARLDALAADTELDDIFRQMAQLKVVTLAGAGMEAAARDATLAALSAPGAPFRVLALEQQAIALMGAGKRDEALSTARAILQEPDVTPGLRRRVAQLIVVLGGDPDAG